MAGQKLEPSSVPTPRPRPAGAPKTPFEREEQMRHEEFLEAVLGKSAQEVVDALGAPPNRTKQAAPCVYWYYENLTVQPTTGNVDDFAQIEFQEGKVVTVYFSAQR